METSYSHPHPGMVKASTIPFLKHVLEEEEEEEEGCGFTNLVHIVTHSDTDLQVAPFPQLDRTCHCTNRLLTDLKERRKKMRWRRRWMCKELLAILPESSRSHSGCERIIITISSHNIRNYPSPSQDSGHLPNLVIPMNLFL